MRPEEVIQMVREQGFQFIDLEFTDLPGTWQHFSITADELSEELFTYGIGFDGSSIRGFQKIEASDMLLQADPDTAIPDPFAQYPTLSLLCNITDPIAEVRDIWGRPIGEKVLRSECDGWIMGRTHGIIHYPGADVCGMAVRDDVPTVLPYPEGVVDGAAR